MNRMLNTVHTALEEVTTQVIVQGGDIISEGNQLNTEIQGLLRNGAVTVALIIFLIICWRAKAAAGAVIGGLFIVAFCYFGVNGGFELLGGMMTQTFGG